MLRSKHIIAGVSKEIENARISTVVSKKLDMWLDAPFEEGHSAKDDRDKFARELVAYMRAEMI